MPRLPCVRRAITRCPPAFLVVIMIAVATAGCGGTKTKNDSTSAGGGAAASDPAIDPDTAFTVDDGRVSVASPRGWTRAERSKEYLVKYQPGRKKPFPAIIVSAADAPAGFPAVTVENHAQFAAALAVDMAEAFGQIGSSGLAKQPVAVTLGQHLGAAWSMPAQATVGGTKQTMEQQFYAVIVGSRMYTIAAQAPKGKLKADAKSAARAVAGAITPPAPAETFAPPAESAPALEADAPADAEAKPAAEAAAQEETPAAK
jgi:hypothetical protein